MSAYSRKLNDEQLFKVNNDLLPHNWSMIQNLPVNEAYKYFNDTIENSLNEHAPIRKIKLSEKRILREKWMTKSLLKCSKKCSELFKKQIGKKKDSVDRLRYLRYRNTFNVVNINTKRSNYSNLVTEHQNNAKNLWGKLNELTGKCNDKGEITTILTKDNIMENDPNVISNTFNEHFANAGKNVAESLPKIHERPKRNK